MKTTKKQKPKFKALLEGLLLFVVALLITIPFVALSLVVTPLKFILTLRLQSGLDQLGAFFKRLAVSIDQFGNAATASLLDFFLIKPNGFKFGHEDDTVSYILGRNKYKKTLTLLGRFIVYVLHIIEFEHVEKAIESKKKADLEAKDRIILDEYYK